MTETKEKPDQIDLAKLKSDMETDFAKEREEFSKKLQESENRLAGVEARLHQEQLEKWAKSPAMLKKLRGESRDLAVAIRMALKDAVTKITFGKGELDLDAAFTKFVEGLPDYISDKPVAAGIGTTMGTSDKDVVAKYEADIRKDNPKMSSTESYALAIRKAQADGAISFSTMGVE